jgi:hypothetical protein
MWIFVLNLSDSCIAVMLFCNAIFLIYTAIISPAQIFLWDNEDDCNTFPTLFLDLCVDSFFMVIILSIFGICTVFSI